MHQSDKWYSHSESNADPRFRRPLHSPLCYRSIWCLYPDSNRESGGSEPPAYAIFAIETFGGSGGTRTLISRIKGPVCYRYTTDPLVGRSGVGPDSSGLQPDAFTGLAFFPFQGCFKEVPFPKAAPEDICRSAFLQCLFWHPRKDSNLQPPG